MWVLGVLLFTCLWHHDCLDVSYKQCWSRRCLRPRRVLLSVVYRCESLDWLWDDWRSLLLSYSDGSQSHKLFGTVCKISLYASNTDESCFGVLWREETFGRETFFCWSSEENLYSERVITRADNTHSHTTLRPRQPHRLQRCDWHQTCRCCLCTG